MTFAHTTTSPSSARLFRLTFTVMLGIVLAGVVALVVLYNQTVAARHGAKALSVQIATLESSNADAQSQLMNQLDSGSLAAFAGTRGLVEDRAPEFLQVPKDTWVFASRR